MQQYGSHNSQSHFAFFLFFCFLLSLSFILFSPCLFFYLLIHCLSSHSPTEHAGLFLLQIQYINNTAKKDDVSDIQTDTFRLQLHALFFCASFMTFYMFLFLFSLYFSMLSTFSFVHFLLKKYIYLVIKGVRFSKVNSHQKKQKINYPSAM